jgi:predicted ferric reductase
VITKPAVLVLGILFILCIGLPVVIIGRTVSFPLDAGDFFYLLGKYFGFLAYFIFLFQYLWTAKVKVFERFISFDRRVSIHRTLGFLGILALCLHPVLILGTYAVQGIPLIVTLPLGMGFGSFLILLLIAGSTFLGRIWGVRYENWKNFHWFTFAVITLAFFHSFIIGSDIYGFFRPFWAALWGIHVIIIVLKFIHKAGKRSKTYEISKVILEAPGVTTLMVNKPKITYKAGQFCFISVRIDGRWEAWHPFSMTSIEAENHVSMTIKALGDFTNRVHKIKAGDLIKIDVGYGGFSPHFVKDSRYIMIAGGIGITPIYSFCKELKSRPNPPEVTLLYSVHHESDILFKSDFDSWFSQIPGWKVHYTVTSQPDWKGDCNRLTPERVKFILSDNLSGTFFLCGPLHLIRSIGKYLKQQGVPRKKIRQEQFVFLP